MKTIKIGSTGPYVQMLQLALRRAGIFGKTLDGIFGSATQNAVVRFQQSNGLTPDGIVGVLTWARLRPFLTGYVTHTAMRGETFWLLAQRYGASVDAIRAANVSIDPLNITPGASVVVPLRFAVVPTDIDYSYDLLSLIIEGLGMRYPALSTGSAGSSVMGKELYYLRIGTGTTRVFYNAAHHANEWITTPVLLRYVEDIANAYTFGGSIFGVGASSLLQGKTLFVVPMVNPDGVDLVTGALTSDSTFYRQAKELSENYPNIPFPNGWKANIEGVDLNLNYPASWDLARETKFSQGYTLPGPRDFVGTAPLSEPESLAMYDFTISNNFALTLSYHSQGEVIYWKYLDYEPPESYYIGQKLAAASGYSLEITPAMSAYAGYKDWFIQTYNRPGYTIEVGSGTNPLPISQFTKIYADNIGLLTVALQLANS